jgi:tetratricopeptide (TPR) repeat protein
LKFAPAKAHFNRVLSALPDHAAARAGLESVCFWEDLLRRIEPLPDPNGPMLLWQTIVQHPLHRNEAEKALRTTLIRFLLTRLEQAGLAFIEPDLSTGHLYLLLGEHVKAERLLRQQINSLPGQGILFGYLADTLWLQGRGELANALYATALLVAPERTRSHTLCNRHLAELVDRYGTELAPINGFLHGLLPLVEPEHPPDTPAVQAQALLRQAEQARHQNDHTGMVTARKLLQHLAPEIFNDSLQWLVAQSEPDSTTGYTKKNPEQLEFRTPFQRERGE